MPPDQSRLYWINLPTLTSVVSFVKWVKQGFVLFSVVYLYLNDFSYQRCIKTTSGTNMWQDNTHLYHFVKISILSSGISVLAQNILDRLCAMQQLHVLLLVEQRCVVLLRKGANVGKPEGARVGPLTQQVESQSHVVHSLQNSVLIVQWTWGTESTLRFVLTYSNKENALNRSQLLGQVIHQLAVKSRQQLHITNQVLTQDRLLCRFNCHKHLPGNPKKQFLRLYECRQHIQEEWRVCVGCVFSICVCFVLTGFPAFSATAQSSQRCCGSISELTLMSLVALRPYPSAPKLVTANPSQDAPCSCAHDIRSGK